MSAKKLGKKLIWALPTLLFLGLFLPTQAAYTPPKKISDSANQTLFPQMAPDKDGYLHLVWMESDFFFSRPNPGIFYSRWNGDTWSVPVKINTSSDSYALSPAVAVDANKRVHVVYQDDTGLGTWQSRIYYASRDPGSGNWSTPVQLPHPAYAFDFAQFPSIAVDTADNLHVIYSVDDFSTSHDFGSIYYTKYEAGSWSDPVFIGHDADGATPLEDSAFSEIHADKQGNVHVGYWNYWTGIYHRKLSEGSWSTPTLLTAEPDIEYFRMTVDDNGNPYLTWYETNDRTVWVRRTDGGLWQAPEQLTSDAERSFWGLPIMGITTNSKNLIAVGWGKRGEGMTQFNAPPIDVEYTYYNPNEPGPAWTPPENVRTDTIWSDTPWLIRDKWDNQHLVWGELRYVSGPIDVFESYKWDLWYSVVQGTQVGVGAGGGTVVANPSDVLLVALEFASGALASDTEITVLIGPLPETVDPEVATVPRAFTFGPEGLTFPAGKEPTVTFTYTDEELAGGDPNTLVAYVWDSQTSTYTAKSGQVNTAQKTLKVTDIDHFSLFAIAARRVSFLPPFKEGLEVEQDSTLPLRFRLAGEVEVVVQLKKGESEVKRFTSGNDTVKYREKEGVYLVNLSTKGLELGEYQIVILRDGQQVAETSFKVVKKGKGKSFEPLELEPTPTPTPTLMPTATPTPTPSPSPTPTPED